MKNTGISVTRGDITQCQVDAVVNAANHSLCGGGGVDGAIHRAAGPQLLEACRLLGGCETGQAKITRGYNLAASYVIHTVGPIWHGGSENEEGLLARAYTNSLLVAVSHGCKTVAFPNISTGVYGFPKRKAAEIAIQTVKDFIVYHTEIEKIIFVCFDKENYSLYQSYLKK